MDNELLKQAVANKLRQLDKEAMIPLGTSPMIGKLMGAGSAIKTMGQNAMGAVGNYLGNISGQTVAGLKQAANTAPRASKAMLQNIEQAKVARDAARMGTAKVGAGLAGLGAAGYAGNRMAGGGQPQQ